MSLFDDDQPYIRPPSSTEISLASIRTPSAALVDHLSRQLELVQKLLGYKYGRNDAETAVLTRGLATFLASYGVADIRDVAPHRVTIQDWRAEGSVGDLIPAVIAYDKRTGIDLYNYQIGNLEDSNYDPPRVYQGYIVYGITETPYWDGASPIPFAIVELPNRYYCLFSVKWTDAGIPIFIPDIRRHSSVSQDLTMIIGAILMVIPGVNVAVSSFLFGSLAATYPVLTSIATNALLNTALSGGDIEQGIKSALSSYAGGFAGGQLGAAFDSELLARVGSSVTSTALMGGDIESAIQNTLLRYGAGQAGDFVADVVETAQASNAPAPVYDIDLEAEAIQPATVVSSEGDSSMFDFEAFAQGDYGLTEMQGTPMQEFASIDLGLDTFDFGTIESPLMDPVNFSDADFDYSGESMDVAENYIAPENFSDADFNYNGGTAPASQVPGYISAEDYADADFGYGSGSTTAPAPVAGQPPGSGDGYTFSQGIKDVSALAMAAIQVSAAYQRTQAPAVQAGSRTSTTGNTVTGQTNGMVTVRSPTGQVVAQKPPVGIPYGTADGSVIVNNGDGTYTVAGINGASVTRPYTDAKASGIDGKTVMIGLGVVGAVLLLAR